MFTSRSMHKTAALWMLASAVVAAPAFAFADGDHGRQRSERHERVDRDDRRSDRDEHSDRHDGRRSDRNDRGNREVRWEQRHDRAHDPRTVHVVEVRRYPPPRFAVAVQFGRPYYPPVPVCYAPAPVCVSSAPACGAYYDPYCNVRYTSFELYLQHVTRTHGITVAIRN